MPRVFVDGLPVDVPEGALLTAALGIPPVACRSLSNEPRGPLCGMGQCFECRVMIGGHEVLPCITPAREGMEVRRG